VKGITHFFFFHNKKGHKKKGHKKGGIKRAECPQYVLSGRMGKTKGFIKPLALGGG
jgi:hypothetical protein